MNSETVTLDVWYDELQQYASGKLQAGLPAVAAVKAYYDAGYTVEDTFNTLFPPKPVTVTQEGLVADTGSEDDEELSQELALAETIQEPRVSEADVMKRIVKKTFTLLPGGRTVMCEIILDNGQYALGESFMDGSDSNNVVAQHKALTKAVRKVWEYEVYLARERIYRQRLADIAKASIGITDQSNG